MTSLLDRYDSVSHAHAAPSQPAGQLEAELAQIFQQALDALTAGEISQGSFRTFGEVCHPAKEQLT